MDEEKAVEDVAEKLKEMTVEDSKTEAPTDADTSDKKETTEE